MNKIASFFSRIATLLDKPKVFLVFSIIVSILGTFTIRIWQYNYSLLLFLFIGIYMLLSSGKYNLVILCYLAGMSFIISNFGIGLSFISMLFIIYLIKLVSVALINKEPLFRYSNGLISFIVFSIYLIILAFIYRAKISIPSQFSFLLFNLFPLLALNDTKAINRVDILLSSLCLGMLISSIIASLYILIPDFNANYFLFIDGTPYGVVDINLSSFRFSGMFFDQNEFALCIAIPCFSYVLLSTEYNFPKKPLFFILPTLLFAFLSQSKSFLIVFFIFIGILVITLLKKNFIKILFRIIFFLFVVVAFVYIFDTLIIDNVFGRFFLNSDNIMASITTGRSELWAYYLNYLFANPPHLFFGMGAKASYVNALLYTHGDFTYMISKQAVVHNFYINLLYDFGIIGSLIYINFVFQTLNLRIILSRNSIIRNIVVFSPLIIFLVYAIGLTLTNSTIQYYLILFMAILANKGAGVSQESITDKSEQDVVPEDTILNIT